MHRRKINFIVQSLVLITLMSCAITAAHAFDNSNAPELPEQCGSIQVPEGNKLAFHAFAKGVQIYKWNLVTQKWDPLAPRAGLFAEPNYFGEVGSHYGGPTWESKSGSKVEGRRVLGTGCTPDPTAVAWLLLSKYRTDGAGIFTKITFIQRVNTTAGLAPMDAGLIDGETREVLCRGRPVSLTAKEFDLLWFLASHPRRVFSRAQLMDAVWGYSSAVDTGTVTVHIRRLREKIEDDPGRPERLETVWGVGYRFSP